MPIFDHFNWIAKYYDRLAGPPEVEPWIRRLRLPASGTLLDAGGGTGRVADLLRPYLSSVVVADSAFNMTRQAAAKDGLQAVQAEGELLPFTNQAFDRAIMVDAFHHVRYQSQVVRELVRVLKPGGRLVIQEPDRRLGAVKVVAVMEKLMLMRSRILYPEQIKELFKGLAVHIEMEAQNGSVWFMIDRLKERLG